MWGSYTNITTPVYDSDGDVTTFSEVELAYIQAVWEVVAEDYAPFNINVTTVEPSVLAPGVPIANANKVAMRVAIGAQVGDWAGGLAISPNTIRSPTHNLTSLRFHQRDKDAGIDRRQSRLAKPDIPSGSITILPEGSPISVTS